MEVVELTSFSEKDLLDIDGLMHQLSATSFCNEEKLQRVMDDAGSHLYVVRNSSFSADAMKVAEPSAECSESSESGRIVATATLCVSHTPEFTLGGVEAVVVDSNCRGKGLARQLMEHIFEEAKRLGCVKLHLTSNPRRVAANALYQIMGFQLYATNYYEKEI